MAQTNWEITGEWDETDECEWAVMRAQEIGEDAPEAEEAEVADDAPNAGWPEPDEEAAIERMRERQAGWCPPWAE